MEEHQSLRVLAALLTTITPAYLLAQPPQVIGRLALASDFPQLPASIARDVTNRGCRIPQVEGITELHNVVSGEFQKRGQRNWAVLCLKATTSTILVYWDESGKNPTQLAPLDETITPYKNGYYRFLQVGTEKFMRDHYDATASGMDRLPDSLDHDGIDDGIFGKGSLIHYLYRGKWLRLTGSD